MTAMPDCTAAGMTVGINADVSAGMTAMPDCTAAGMTVGINADVSIYCFDCHARPQCCWYDGVCVPQCCCFDAVFNAVWGLWVCLTHEAQARRAYKQSSAAYLDYSKTPAVMTIKHIPIIQ